MCEALIHQGEKPKVSRKLCTSCGCRGFHSVTCVLGGDLNRPVLVCRSLVKRTHEVVRTDKGSYVEMRQKDMAHSRRVSRVSDVHAHAVICKNNWDIMVANGQVPDYEVYE